MKQGLRRFEVRERTAQRVVRMRAAVRPLPSGEAPSHHRILLVRRFNVWEIASVFSVPLRLFISWKPRRGRRAA